MPEDRGPREKRPEPDSSNAGQGSQTGKGQESNQAGKNQEPGQANVPTKERPRGPEQGMRMFGAIAPSMIPLGLKMGMTYLRFKKRAQKGEKIFRKELKAQGLDAETASKLTDMYMETSHVMKNMVFKNLGREWA